jgi:hypothetical protein
VPDEQPATALVDQAFHPLWLLAAEDGALTLPPVHDAVAGGGGGGGRPVGAAAARAGVRDPGPGRRSGTGDHGAGRRAAGGCRSADQRLAGDGRRHSGHAARPGGPRPPGPGAVRARPHGVPGPPDLRRGAGGLRADGARPRRRAGRGRGRAGGGAHHRSTGPVEQVVARVPACGGGRRPRTGAGPRSLERVGQGVAPGGRAGARRARGPLRQRRRRPGLRHHRRRAGDLGRAHLGDQALRRSAGHAGRGGGGRPVARRPRPPRPQRVFPTLPPASVAIWATAPPSGWPRRRYVPCRWAPRTIIGPGPPLGDVGGW